MAPDPDAPYTGPSVPHMLATHTLAREIINRHDDPCPIFDGKTLLFLQSYVTDATPIRAQKILEERGMIDPETGGVREQALAENRSLVTYLIARDYKSIKNKEGSEGIAPERGLTEHEILALKEWFEQGHAEERIQGWRNGINA